MLINDNGIILFFIGKMLLTFQSTFPYYFSCQTVKQAWIGIAAELGPELALLGAPRSLAWLPLLWGPWPSFVISSQSVSPTLPLHFPHCAYVILVFLAVAWSSVHSTLCSLEQSYYRNLINNKFQPSDRSIKCMIRRGHYGKWKMHKRMPTAWVSLQPEEAEPHETNTNRAILGHLEAFIFLVHS